MRYKKIFSAVALATILSLLAITLAASPALAVENLTLDPDEGEIGDEIDVDGEEFNETETRNEVRQNKRVTIYFTSEKVERDDDIDDIEAYAILDLTQSVDDDRDDFSSNNLEIPYELDEDDLDEDEIEEVNGGTYYVFVTYKGEDDIQAVAEFTVIAGEIEIDPEEGIVGTEVDIGGSYFDSRDDITVTIDDVVVDIESGDDDTDSSGAFDSTIIVPELTAGDHTIAVEDENDHIAEATFTVESALGVSPTEGTIGSQATASGTGFGGSESVTITFDGAQVTTVRADSDGSFITTFTVPQVEAGTYTVEAEDADDNSATADFTMSSSVTLGIATSAASPGYVGMQMTMTGTGFLPNTAVSITFATTPVVVATTTSDANGDFLATFTIPPSEPGTHTITATDGTNSLTETFYMESTPPPIAQPLLPEMGIKAKQPVYFDWADVTDPSGITYTLQIATDENFTSVVLEKTDLADSKYTLTAAEKLEKRSEETPYYWRVKATDGAYNESGWTGVGSFYVGGFSFGGISTPDWMIHLWWGLGAAGAFIGGYFMSKRRAYYY